MNSYEIAVFAISAIRPNGNFSVADTYKSLRWSDENDDEKPTEQEFDDAVTAWNTEYDAQEYARDRAVAYDSVGNQLDMIYKDNLNGTTTHKTSVEAVKAKYPKPD
tara:strand:- start:77 stop:394 length:318 start_codon:yes stop_codon:yes gene_type:complete